MSYTGLNSFGQLLVRDGKLKTCECLKDEVSLTNSEKSKLFQVIHALPKRLREIVATYDGNLSNVFLPDHNLIKKTKTGLRLDSKELYKMQVLLKYIKPTSQHYFEKHFSQTLIEKKYIFFHVL